MGRRRRRDMGLELALATVAVMSIAAAVTFFLIEALPDAGGVALTVVSATASALSALHRWLPTKGDVIDQAYMCGWADCARRQTDPYPVETQRPLRPVQS